MVKPVKTGYRHKLANPTHWFEHYDPFQQTARGRGQKYMNLWGGDVQPRISLDREVPMQRNEKKIPYIGTFHPFVSNQEQGRF